MKKATRHLLKQVFTKARCLALIGLLALVLGAGAAQAQVYGYVVVNGSLLVVDSATNVVVTTVPGLAIPRAVDVSPDGSQVYVTISNGVAVIDAATNTVVATVPTGNIPIGTVFTPDGSIAYVGNNASATVSVIDTATQTVTATVGPLALSGIGITPDGSEVWVCVGSVSGASIAIIDTATNTISTTFPTGHGLNGAFGIDFTSDGAFAYLANGDNTVSVIDTATLATVAAVPVGSLPFALALTPDDAYAYTPNLTGASVSVVDTATTTVVATVPVGALPRDIAITPDGTRAWVSNYNSNTVSVIDTATQTVISTFPASLRPWGIDFMPDSDVDGIGEIFDLCPLTPAGELVEPATGCSIDQLCPCDSPFGSTQPWKNHGVYVLCVNRTARTFYELGLLTSAEKHAIIAAARASSCGT